MPEDSFVTGGRSKFARSILALRERDWIGPFLIAGSGLCFFLFVFLTFDAVRDQAKPLIALLALPIMGLIALGAALVIGWKPGRERFRDHLLSKEGGATIALALLQAIGAITSVLGLLEPRMATVADTDRISTQVADVGIKVDSLTQFNERRFPNDPPVLREIVGRWGEEDPRCGLVWDISIVRSGDAAALVAERVVLPEGVEPFRLLAEITRAEGNRLWITGQEPVSVDGLAAEFTVRPATQRLVWDDKASAASVEEYVRCPVR